MASDNGVFTPYSTVLPLIDELPSWVPSMDSARIASYAKYDELYWNYPRAFKLVTRGDEALPIYVPNPKQICDSTAHFLMKGLQVSSKDTATQVALQKFLKREGFYSLFHTNKLTGVTRGDYIFHLIAEPGKPEGTRLSVKSIDPASYFPITSDNDPDKILGIRLVEQIIMPDNDVNVRIQDYWYVIDKATQRRRVMTSEAIWKTLDWDNRKRAQKVEQIRPARVLPEGIDTIPVFHFKNVDWQGQDFGSSELRGYERLLTSINQSVTDEELALALDGLGVYATDAAGPIDADGNDEEWEIAPGKVVELPSGAYLKRVEGLGSVKPTQDHIKFLTDSLYESNGAFRPGTIDVQVAQSGISLAIRFLPTLAKTEQRELSAQDILAQFFWNWKIWHGIYENEQLPEGEITIELGDKLPLDPVRRINELNNMLDRNVISRKYYRDEMQKLGYEFPSGIEEDILKELAAIQKIQAPPPTSVVDATGKPVPVNQSNNAKAPNESKGTEATPAKSAR
jgi:hypothetical protein